MRVILLLLIMQLVISCERKTDAPKDVELDSKGEWKDESLYSMASFPGPEDSEEEGTERLLDPKFAELLLNEIVGSEGVEYYSSNDTSKLTLQQVNSILRQPEVIQVEDPNNPGSFNEVQDTMEITPDHINEIVVKESWHYNHKKGQLQKKIELLGPVMNVFDSEGNLKGKKLLFWIKLKK